MNSDVVNEIARTLVELHRVIPSMRFGQLVLTVATSARGPQVESTYDVTDEEFLAAAQRLLERNRSSAGLIRRSVRCRQKPRPSCNPLGFRELPTGFQESPPRQSARPVAVGWPVV